MIRHTILFKTKPTVSKKVMDDLVVQLWGLKKYIPGMISVVGGQCEFHEASPATSFSHGFSIDFNDQKALDSFFEDSITHSVKDSILEIAEGGDKVIIGFNFKG